METDGEYHRLWLVDGRLQKQNRETTQDLASDPAIEACELKSSFQALVPCLHLVQWTITVDQDEFYNNLHSFDVNSLVKWI